MRNTISTRPTPDLSDAQLLGAVCGLRPCRHGGLRLESEQIGKHTIVHNYGHGGCGITIGFGTAEIAVDLVDQAASEGDTVAVVGGGIAGLMSAFELLNRGYKVHIYAQKFGVDTTSGIAGALWLPMAIEFGETAREQHQKARILTRSYAFFQSIDRELYGVEKMPIYEPANSHTEHNLFGHLYDHGLIDFPEEVQSFPFASTAEPGQRFTVDFIHTNQFLAELIKDIKVRGGELIERQFESCEDVLSLDERVIVNCTALGSKKLFNDQQLYPARGVLVHMKPQDLGYGIHDGFKYMFPRNNALILGGCCQDDDWNEMTDQTMIDEILTHHRQFFGQL